MKEVDVLIPARNDGDYIQKTLDSIQDQEFSGDYQYNVLVVANGCTDNTVERVAANIDRFAANEHTALQVIELGQGNKIAAINAGLLATSKEVCFSVDSDVTFSERCFDLMARKLEDPAIKVSGAIPRMQVAESAKDTLLGRVQRVSELAFAARSTFDGPYGGAMAFKRTAVSRFPDNATVDDTWLGLVASHEYGLEAVQMEMQAEVYTRFPLTWSDWLAQRTRWHHNGDAVLEQFPEYAHVLAERKQRYRYSLEELDQRTLATMEQEGISAEHLPQYRFFVRMCIDNAQLTPKIIDQDGGWSDLSTS
jgi:glycosyltransferase involved in cell wall biosynthesis